MLFSGFMENLERGEVRKLIKNIKLFRIVRTSTNCEKLQRNHIQLSKKIPQKLYSRTGKCSEKGRRPKVEKAAVQGTNE